MAAAILKNPKSRYFDNGLTDRHEIWHGDTIRNLRCVPQLRICNFKNTTWRRPPFWKIEKLQYLGRSFSDFNEIWQGDAVRPSWLLGRLQIWNVTISKMAAADILKTIKYGTISRQRFDRSAHNLHNDAYWPSEPDQQLKFRTPILTHRGQCPFLQHPILCVMCVHHP